MSTERGYFVSPGHVIEYENTTDELIAAGTAFAINDEQIAVAKVNIKSGEAGSAAVTGIWSLPKKTGLAFDQGDQVYLADGAITGEASGAKAGYVWVSSPADQTDVEVKIG